jgi:membrane-associated phospholipid phosphatase
MSETVRREGDRRRTGTALGARLRATRERMPWWSSHLLGVGSVLVILGGFLKLTLEVFQDTRVTAIDDTIMTWVVAHRTETITRMAIDITALGSATLVGLFSIGALYVLLVVGDRRGALHLLLALAGSGAMIAGLKGFLERPRPIGHRLVEAGGYSYPSGHAVSAAVLYVTLALVGSKHFKGPVYRRMLVALSVGVTLLVAASRVYLGVHYPTDITSGTALGAGWAVLLTSVFAYDAERVARVKAAAEKAAAPSPAV